MVVWRGGQVDGSVSGADKWIVVPHFVTCGKNKTHHVLYSYRILFITETASCYSAMFLIMLPMKQRPCHYQTTVQRARKHPFSETRTPLCHQSEADD